jgi:hypothetical protein
MPEADADGVHRNSFFVERISKGLAEAVKLCALDTLTPEKRTRSGSSWKMFTF